MTLLETLEYFLTETAADIAGRNWREEYFYIKGNEEDMYYETH